MKTSKNVLSGGKKIQQKIRKRENKGGEKKRGHDPNLS